QRDGDQGSAAGDQQIGRMGDPGQGVVIQQQVAHRTATQRGDATQQAYAQPVHFAASGGEGGGHGFGGDGHDEQCVQEFVGDRAAGQGKTPGGWPRMRGRQGAAYRFDEADARGWRMPGQAAGSGQAMQAPRMRMLPWASSGGADSEGMRRSRRMSPKARPTRVWSPRNDRWTTRAGTP